ncbi:hypothetical protein [Chroococcidiopsis sp.]|uniref:hypothetical protein n=1 Tax=Chroococcidiopsis sp. TaxID=3088168 RepID=UPI003F35A84E
MHPQIKIVGETSDGTIRAIAVNSDGSLVTSGGDGGDGGSDASLYGSVLNAPDLYKTINYFDEGTGDERIATITISSPSLNVEFSDSYVYGGTAGSYRVVAVSRTQGTPG